MIVLQFECYIFYDLIWETFRVSSQILYFVILKCLVQTNCFLNSRWGHGGFKELYPDKYKEDRSKSRSRSRSSNGSGSDRGRKRSRSRSNTKVRKRKKDKKKKKKKKSRHRSNSFDDSLLEEYERSRQRSQVEVIHIKSEDSKSTSGRRVKVESVARKKKDKR